ncbi:hypothetical protein SDC9_190978 [bioreactor metagenome]|uniref:Uncharacterized protein n=1 Tax=bioreactor metagenome TaxID=1076179 RepID=A0A645HWL9_9ZZZZ
MIYSDRPQVGTLTRHVGSRHNHEKRFPGDIDIIRHTFFAWDERMSQFFTPETGNV